MNDAVRRHLPFIVVATVLTLVMTFPTIVYVFRMDEFLLPAKYCCDAFQKIWDAWYVKQILAGQADLLHTNTFFYPDGVSLTYHPLFYLHGLLVAALQLFMPVSNAYSLVYLLIVFSSVCAAYAYLHWLFKDCWLATFGAVIFGFCPQVVLTTSWPEVGWLAPLPLIVYGFHRGVVDKRASLIGFAGLLAGLLTGVSMYAFVCGVITLALFVCALAVSRWRDLAFWRRVLLLMIALTLASAWRVVPMLLEADQINRASQYVDPRIDLISFFTFEKNPILGPLAKEFLQIPENPKTSEISYIGLVPIALICCGLVSRKKRLD